MFLLVSNVKTCFKYLLSFSISLGDYLDCGKCAGNGSSERTCFTLIYKRSTEIAMFETVDNV